MAALLFSPLLGVYLPRVVVQAVTEGWEFARLALYKNAPMVILDEPTASLDPLAESGIYEKFGTLVKGKLAMFISHRLSSCRFCDRILVLQGGRIVQDGSHEELASRDGLYREMWEAQRQYYV